MSLHIHPMNMQIFQFRRTTLAHAAAFIAGTVVAVNGAVGAAATEGQTVIHVASLDKLWLEARIAESDLGRISRPSGAFFTLDGARQGIALDVGRNARLIAYGGMVDATTRTVPAIIEFDNPSGSLRAGMNVDRPHDPLDLFRYVFAEQTPQLREQQAQLETELAAEAADTGGH